MPPCWPPAREIVVGSLLEVCAPAQFVFVRFCICRRLYLCLSFYLFFVLEVKCTCAICPCLVWHLSLFVFVFVFLSFFLDVCAPAQYIMACLCWCNFVSVCPFFLFVFVVICVCLGRICTWLAVIVCVTFLYFSILGVCAPAQCTSCHSCICFCLS